MDNFLEKGLVQAFETYKTNISRELAELETVKTAMGQTFSQKDELTLTRENHGAIIRELQRMQDDSNYVSEWEPKKALPVQSLQIDSIVTMPPPPSVPAFRMSLG